MRTSFPNLDTYWFRDSGFNEASRPSHDAWLSMLCARARQFSSPSPSPKFTMEKPAAADSSLLIHVLCTQLCTIFASTFASQRRCFKSSLSCFLALPHLTISFLPQGFRDACGIIRVPYFAADLHHLGFHGFYLGASLYLVILVLCVGIMSWHLPENEV